MDFASLITGNALQKKLKDDEEAHESDLVKTKKEMIIKEFVRSTGHNHDSVKDSNIGSKNQNFSQQVKHTDEKEQVLHAKFLNNCKIVSILDDIKSSNSKKLNSIARMSFDVQQRKRLEKYNLSENLTTREKSVTNPGEVERSNLYTTYRQSFATKMARDSKINSIAMVDLSPRSEYIISNASKDQFTIYPTNSMMKSEYFTSEHASGFIPLEDKSDPERLKQHLKITEEKLEKCESQQCKEELYQSSLEHIRNDKKTDIHVYQIRMREIKKLTHNIDSGIENAVDIHWAANNMIKSTKNSQCLVRSKENCKKIENSDYLEELKISKERYSSQNEVVHNDLAVTLAQEDLKKENIESLHVQQQRADKEFASCSLKISEFNDLLNNIKAFTKVENYLKRIIKQDNDIYNVEDNTLFCKQNQQNDISDHSLGTIDSKKSNSYQNLQNDDNESENSQRPSRKTSNKNQIIKNDQANLIQIKDGDDKYSKTHVNFDSDNVLDNHSGRWNHKTSDEQLLEKDVSQIYNQDVKNSKKLLSNIKTMKIKTIEQHPSTNSTNFKESSVTIKLKTFEQSHPQGASEFIGSLIDIFHTIKRKNIDLQQHYSEGLDDLIHNRQKLADLKVKLQKVTAHQKNQQKLANYYKNIDSKYVSDVKYSTSSGMMMRNNYPINRISTKLVDKCEIVTHKQLQSKYKPDFDFHDNKVVKKRNACINCYGFLIEYISKILKYTKQITELEDEMYKPGHDKVIVDQKIALNKAVDQLNYKHKKSFNQKFGNDENSTLVDIDVVSPEIKIQKYELKNQHKGPDLLLDEDFITLLLKIIVDNSNVNEKDILLLKQALLTDKIIWLTLDKKTIAESILIHYKEKNSDYYINHLIKYYLDKSNEVLQKKFDLIFKPMIDIFKTFQGFSLSIRDILKQQLDKVNILERKNIENTLNNIEATPRELSNCWKVAMQKKDRFSIVSNLLGISAEAMFNSNIKPNQKYEHSEEDSDDLTLDKVQDMLESCQPHIKANNYRYIVDKNIAKQKEIQSEIDEKLNVNVKYLNDEEFFEYQRHVFNQGDQRQETDVVKEDSFQEESKEGPQEEMKSILYNMRSQDRIGVQNAIKEKNPINIGNFVNKFAEEKLKGNCTTNAYILNKVKHKETFATSPRYEQSTRKHSNFKSTASPLTPPKSDFIMRNKELNLKPVTTRIQASKSVDKNDGFYNLQKGSLSKDNSTRKFNTTRSRVNLINTTNGKKLRNLPSVTSHDYQEDSMNNRFGTHSYAPQTVSTRRNVTQKNLNEKLTKEGSNNFTTYKSLNLKSEYGLELQNRQPGDNIFYKKSSNHIKTMITKTSLESNKEKIEKHNIRIELIKSQTQHMSKTRQKEDPSITASNIYFREMKHINYKTRDNKRSSKFVGLFNEGSFFKKEVNKDAEEFMPKIIDKKANLRY